MNAELLIDQAWGWEPCTIADVKAYRPESNSIGSGQVLQHPYSFQKARLVVHEMADALALELVGKRLVTNQLVLTAGYDIENLTDPERRKEYKGPVTVDRYGRAVPKHAHGTERLGGYTSSAKELVQGALALFDRVVDVQDIVIEAWKELLKDTPYKPIDIHTPLWLWSRSGFIPLDESVLNEK